MKFKDLFMSCIAFLLLSLTGCSQQQTMELANEIQFPLAGISEVTISYDEEQIAFFLFEEEELIVKEYMTENKSGYYARVSQSNASIRISEGGKPFIKNGFSRRIEVFLPSSYTQALTVTTTNGNIDFTDIELRLLKLRIDSTFGTTEISKAMASSIHLSTTSGAFTLGYIEAETIRLETTSGNIACDTLIGTVEYTSTSGDVCINNAVGKGSYKANNSGDINVIYTEVVGDLYFYNKNDSIHLTLPQNLSFEFEATTKNGFIFTPFQECVRFNGRTAYAVVGNNPTVTVKTETNNGNITVRQ